MIVLGLWRFLEVCFFQRDDELNARNDAPAQSIVVGDEHLAFGDRRAGELDRVGRSQGSILAQAGIDARALAVERNQHYARGIEQNLILVGPTGMTNR